MGSNYIHLLLFVFIFISRIIGTIYGADVSNLAGLRELLYIYDLTRNLEVQSYFEFKVTSDHLWNGKRPASCSFVQTAVVS